MLLTLVREFEIKDATIGTLSIDGVFQCHTLEDVQRASKIEGKTAIPIGDYKVTVEYSPRFSASYEKKGLGNNLPRLHGIPGFQGVLIHIGNYAKDTEGCILVGSWNRNLKNMISGSTTAYKLLHQKLVTSKDAIRISIRDQVAPQKEELRQVSPTMYAGLHPAKERRNGTMTS